MAHIEPSEGQCNAVLASLLWEFVTRSGHGVMVVGSSVTDGLVWPEEGK
jgi:hypothetical protein